MEIKSLKRHTWYLDEQLVVLALADKDLPDITKVEMIKNLLINVKPETFRRGPPTKVLNLDFNSTLPNLVGPESWILFDIVNVSKEDVYQWIKGDSGSWENLESYRKFVQFVKNMQVTNDCAERNIRLIQDFVFASKSEDQRQNVMLVAREERKRMPANVTKKRVVAMKKLENKINI